MSGRRFLLAWVLVTALISGCSMPVLSVALSHETTWSVAVFVRDLPEVSHYNLPAHVGMRASTQRPLGVWLVRDGDQWWALSDRSTDYPWCRIHWYESRQYFADLCHGSRYDRQGRLVSAAIWVKQGRGLDSYPIQVSESGIAEIDLAQPESAAVLEGAYHWREGLLIDNIHGN